MANTALVPVSLSAKSLQESLVSGCTNRPAIGDYLDAVVFEARVKGLVSGVFVGAGLGVAFLIWRATKGGG